MSNKTKKWIFSIIIFICSFCLYHLGSMYLFMIAMSHLNWKEQNPEAKLTLTAKWFYYLIEKTSYFLSYISTVISKIFPGILGGIVTGTCFGLIIVIIFLVLIKTLKKTNVGEK